MKALRWINLVLAALAILAPAAHVLELPNKLALGGPLWLAIQQHLYRGWGPAFGAPVEIGALLTTFALALLRRGDRATLVLTLVAAAAYAGMIAAFFIFNKPVNEALNRWSPATLPTDWARYRRQWETGHVVAALLAVIGLVSVARGWLIEHDRGTARPGR